MTGGHRTRTRADRGDHAAGDPDERQGVPRERHVRLVQQYLHLAPSPTEVVVGERHLGGHAADGEAGLHLDLHDGRHRGPRAAQHVGGTDDVAAPEGGPDARPHEVRRERNRRVERERAVDERVGSLPLAEGEERVDGVRREDDARAALDALGACTREPVFGETHGLGVSADEVVQV